MEVSIPNVCVIWDCNSPAASGGVFCAGHAGEASGPPGVVEPALEARLAAKLASMAPPPPRLVPQLDQGDLPIQAQGVITTTTATDPMAYIQSCLAGRHGTVAKMLGESMVKAVAAVLIDL